MNYSPNLFSSSMMTSIIIGVVAVIIIVFVIVSSITSKKAQKKEQANRKRVVKDEIKFYLAKTQSLKNIKLEYEKVYARKGPEYKYRDVFDVVVQMYEPKTNKLMYTRAYEVEGITTKASKKSYTTSWQVNTELDLEDTKRRIAIAEKKIKLSKEERKLMKIEDSKKAKEQKLKEKEEMQPLREEKAKQRKDNTNKIDDVVKATTVKFVPKRNK